MTWCKYYNAWFIITALVASVGVKFLDPQIKPAPMTQYIAAEFPPQKGEYDLLVTRIIDGDTVDAYFLVPIQGRGRLYGINTPEMNTPEGKLAKKHLSELLPTGQLHRCVLVGREKFGGTLLILFDSDGRSINGRMIEDGHAKEYIP